MTKKNIVVIYFSGTNVTATYAKAIAKELTKLGNQVRDFNITPYASRQIPLAVEEYDGFIFGFPVYSDIAPGVVNEWLTKLDGKGKKCAMFFTYGGRTSGYAHFHTFQLLQHAGFQVEFSAEFPGPHTYNVGGWTALTDRPNSNDMDVARNFAALAIQRFSAPETSGFILQKPFGYKQAMDAKKNRPIRTERGWTNPVRITETCDMCRLCETECPTQSFNADTGLSDFTTCIDCMHCVYICPQQVIKINEGMKSAYQKFLSDYCLTEEMMSAKKSKLITHSWEASA